MRKGILIIVSLVIISGCSFQNNSDHPGEEKQRVIESPSTLDRCSKEFQDCIAWTAAQDYKEDKGLLELSMKECIDNISECG